MASGAVVTNEVFVNSRTGYEVRCEAVAETGSAIIGRPSSGIYTTDVGPDGGEAVKRTVRLGRRNANYIEVLEGLEPGEKVLTSPYTGFADKDRLDLETK